MSDLYISNFLKSKTEWIQTQLNKVQNKTLLTDKDAKVYLLGKAYSVNVSIDTKIENVLLVFEESTVCFKVKSSPDHSTLQTIRDEYYKKLCGDNISPIVEQYAKEMNLYPAKITYRHNRSRWGSCSSQNRISLNTRLMMLPKDIINYVVIHELAHIRHKNHSKIFWNEVYKFCPNYKKLRLGIRKFEAYL